MFIKVNLNKKSMKIFLFVIFLHSFNKICLSMETKKKLFKRNCYLYYDDDDGDCHSRRKAPAHRHGLSIQSNLIKLH
uniref:Putative secreted protein n=1 Tax=Psorophora albipes TaxID=869069 RepID=T1D5U4_9DIPT